MTEKAQLKAGQVYRYKDVPSSLYLVVKHNDGNCSYYRLVPLVGRTAFQLGEPELGDSWFKKNMELAYESLEPFLPKH